MRVGPQLWPKRTGGQYGRHFLRRISMRRAGPKQFAIFGLADATFYLSTIRQGRL